MPTYAIGDVQGCFGALEKLLAKIQFDSLHDTLWFTGDLVNRGPDSLKTLRFVRALGDNHRTVLGNHDLHLLAVALSACPMRQSDTFDDILNASDRDELIAWLIKQPLLVHEQGYVMVHAGILPGWTIKQAISFAREVEAVMQSDYAIDFLKQMYGNLPDRWDSALTGIERLRYIVNSFTRMRFCYPDGRLDLHYKGAMRDKPEVLIPWFDVPDRQNKDTNIIFGHWAALGGMADTEGVYPLDTGCVWGNCLTAMRLDTKERICVKC